MKNIVLSIELGNWSYGGENKDPHIVPYKVNKLYLTESVGRYIRQIQHRKYGASK